MNPAADPVIFAGPVPPLRRRFSVRALGALLWIPLLVAVFALWPQRFGGATSFVVVRGISMLPTYQSADLVIARSHAHYRVGDIVVYRVPSGAGAGSLIVHRLVGIGANESITTKGDNRSTNDGFDLHLKDIVGTPIVRIPAGGRLLMLASTWWFLALTTGIAVAWKLWPDNNTTPAQDDPHVDITIRAEHDNIALTRCYTSADHAVGAETARIDCSAEDVVPASEQYMK